MAEPIQCPNCKLYNPPRTRRCDCGWEFGKSRADQSIAVAPREFQGIRGWLLLFAFGLVFMFFKHVVNIQAAWQVVNSPVEIGRSMMLFQLVTSLLSVVALFPIGVLFLQRRRSTRRLIIIFLVFQLVVTIVTVVMITQVPELWRLAGIRNEMVRTVLSAVLSAGIWIPYFIVSKRVDETFVR